MVEPLRRKAIGGDHQGNRRRLHRDLDILEAHLLEVAKLELGGLDQRLRRGAPVLGGDIGVERTSIDADADWHASVLGLGGDRPDLVRLAQVAGVQSQTLNPCLERGIGHLLVEVNVGDDRHRRARHDVGQALCGSLLVAGAAHDVGPRRRKLVDLLEGPFDVSGLGRRHGLDRHRRIAADLDRADLDLTCCSARAQELLGGLHGSILPCRRPRPTGTGWRPGERCRDTSTSTPGPGGMRGTRRPPASSW